MVGSDRYSQEVRLFYRAIAHENGRAAQMWTVARLFRGRSPDRPPQEPARPSNLRWTSPKPARSRIENLCREGAPNQGARSWIARPPGLAESARAPPQLCVLSSHFSNTGRKHSSLDDGGQALP